MRKESYWRLVFRKMESNGFIYNRVNQHKNSLVERFNRTFREDVLDSYMFEDLSQARKYANAWAWMYNNERPHSALGYLTPVEFLLKYGKRSTGSFPHYNRTYTTITNGILYF